MKWQKLGRVYVPSGELPWARSYAANPVAEWVKDDLFRIYFSTRNEKNQSSIGCVFLDLNHPTRGIEASSEPVLSPGDLAMHDDSGVSIGQILSVNGKRYLYYMGWNLSVTVPWKNSIGLAISDVGQDNFKRTSRFPIIGLDDIDPYTISYPWVRVEDGLFRMWYGSNLKWGAEKKDMLHVIKYAESHDGIHWKKSDHICIDSTGPAEYAICKPCVLKDGNTYKMWYSYRGLTYRIGYAESKDGITWTRLDHMSGIDVSKDGWDSEMIEYASVFDHKDKRYMLYAGNTFGKTGFGIAVCSPG
jgi:predicted GH43/DUF377 family glycosyl hydrolase